MLESSYLGILLFSFLNSDLTNYLANAELNLEFGHEMWELDWAIWNEIRKWDLEYVQLYATSS